MHMADALLAPTVAATMYVASGAVVGTSIYKIKKDDRIEKLPMMGVMAAFVFAGQMINYTIPGTGSSGHLCGGLLLTALLGPYAGFLSMVVVLAIQALFFADGGLMALGANCWNMAFYGCFVGYFLIYSPLVKSRMSNMRLKLTLASVLGSVITLQMGALSVCVETFASGVSQLPFGGFMILMQPIHLAIGLVEGLITAAVLIFVYQTRPVLLECVNEADGNKSRMSLKGVVVILAVAAVIIAGIGSQFASANPDGLEWSLFGNEEGGYSANMGLDEENFGVESEASQVAAAIQENTAFLPDYSFAGDGENPAGTSVSGIVGVIIVAVIAILICLLGGFFRRKKLKAHSMTG